jgi:hypothetical protein
MSLTLNDLIAQLNTISKEHPELLDESVEINFDGGAFREIYGVAINPITNKVVISEDFITNNSFK